MVILASLYEAKEAGSCSKEAGSCCPNKLAVKFMTSCFHVSVTD